MRSSPTEADRALLATVAAARLTATVTQLERWRQHGLVPRGRIVRDGWGGSRALPADENAFEAVQLLAGLSSRGRPWQFGGLALFEEGIAVSERCLRDCATWLQERRRRQWARVWTRAEQAVTPDPHDAHGELTDIAFNAAEIAKTNRVLRTAAGEVQGRIQQIDASMTTLELRTAAERSLGWRVADMMDLGGLNDQDRLLARYGTDRRPDPATWRPALDSEAFSCAQTLTAGEAYTYRRFVITLAELRGIDLPAGRALLDLVAWEVCEARINTKSQDPATALPMADLQDLHKSVEDAWSAADRGLHSDQLELFETTSE